MQSTQSAQPKEKFSIFREDFVKYLHTSNQVEEESLETLKNLKIAIHGSYLIHNIIQSSNINLLQGYSKYQLSRYLRRLLECFQKHNTKVVVVFEGIIYSKDDKDIKSAIPEIAQKVRSTWQQVLKNPKDSQIPELLRDFSQFYFAETEITGILDELGIEYVHAPYYNAAQMKWFVDYSYAHLACCGLEGIIFNFNHIIVDFDFKNEKFYWLDVKKLQKFMGLDQNKMASLFLIHGYNPNLNTFIPIDYVKLLENKPEPSETKPEYSFENAKTQLVTGVNINKIVEWDEAQLNAYHGLRRKLEHNLIFNSDCEVNLLTSTSYDAINDHFGPHFPSELYIFFVYNLIDRELIDSIANGHFIVYPPLSDSAEYHHHIDNYFKTMLEKITGVFTAKLHQKFKTGPYTLIRFYFLDRPFSFTPREYKPSKFVLKQSIFDKEKAEHANRTKKAGFCRVLQTFTDYVRETTTETKKPMATRKESLDFVLSAKLSSPLAKNKSNEENFEMAKEAESPQHSDKSLQSPAEPNLDQPQTSQEILNYLYLSFLETYDYVNTHTKSLMVIGAALRKCDENFEESLVMLMELMKPNLCLVNGREFSNSRARKVSSEAPFNTPDKREHNDNEFYQINLWSSNIEAEEKEEILLISRVFSLINASISTAYPESNYADYDYDLCQYLGVLKHVQKMLRFSFESLMVHTYFTCCSKKDMKVLLGLKKQFPFRNSLSVSLGIAVKKLLQAKESLSEFKEKNPHLINLEYDLKNGYRLWENVVFLLKYQESKGEFTLELLELVKRAHILLEKRFRELNLVEN